MPEIETLMLANHAEAINGLLYVSGGGWTHHWRGTIQEGQPPPPSSIGIAVGVLVPWSETNRRHRLELRIESEDGAQLATVEGDLEVGRPPGTPSGSDQRAVLAINATIPFPAAGGYRVVGEFLGKPDTKRSVSFIVHDQPMPAR